MDTANPATVVSNSQKANASPKNNQTVVSNTQKTTNAKIVKNVVI